MNLATHTEHTLRTYHLLGQEELLPEEFIPPHYGGYSIANLPAMVARLLGAELPGAAPPLAEHLWADMAAGVRRVIVVVLDAVGYVHLQRVLVGEDTFLHRLAQAGLLVPITSVFPSTTVAALTTLWTGWPPGGHGFVGTQLLLSEQGLLANMLRLAPAAHRRSEELLDWGWDPGEFVTAPSLGQQLTASGVETVAHTYYPFIGGGLDRVFLRGMTHVQGYAGFSDMWINLRHTLRQRRAEPLFTSVYWGGIDAVSHLYGPDGEPFQATLRHLFRSLDEDFLGPLPAAAREGTLLMITADHGQTMTPPERAVRLSDHPTLRRTLLLPPAAESRAAYLYVQPGQAGTARAYIAEHLADRYFLMEAERALAVGLFGPDKPHPEVRARLGDLLLLARNDSQLLVDEEQEPLRGHHGSLTPEEMLVPLLMMRLDAL